jgi:FtsP/CotA-like multicopper oxidase with cupredoxin domain
MLFPSKKARAKTAVVASLFLLSASLASAQVNQINLTAAPTMATMPDGLVTPMWGYSCGAANAGSAAACRAANPAANGGWSPVVITVPMAANATTANLTINLTNGLVFANGANPIPTSLTIVGQLGGGLGTPTKVPSPAHAELGVTWPVAGAAAAGAEFTPPKQGPRVQSFGTEVPGLATTALTWAALRPGTYLLESGTHPSIQATMGLYGVIVVTAPPSATNTPPITETSAGTAYPNVTYDAELPLVFGEIDPVQNNAVSMAVNTPGFSETAVWSGQPGACGNPTSPNYHTSIRRRLITRRSTI